MIRLTDPTRIGPALAEVRNLQLVTRRQLARTLAEKLGRSETSVNAQLWTWDVGTRKPDLASLGPLLDALGYDLALIPREAQACTSTQPWRCTPDDCPGCFNPHCWAVDEKTCRACDVKPRTPKERA